MDWNRDNQIDQQIQWARCFEEANANAGQAGDSYGGGKGRGKYASSDLPAVGKSVTWQSNGKLESGGAPATTRTARDDSMAINFNRIDKKKWDHEYGEIRVQGKVTLLCWYHCNRPGGCVRETECVKDHKLFPTSYNAKPLGKCSASFQKEVLAKCKSE